MTKPTIIVHESKIVETRTLTAAYATSRLLLKTNRIAFFDGPPGTGKTTAATVIAEKADRPVAMMTMSFRPAHLDVLRHTMKALTGLSGSGTKSQMEDELTHILTDWGGLLIVDEVQNCGTAGIQTLRYLHDRTGCSFALLLVGWQALDTIRAYPDLQSRVISEVMFTPISGRELFNYIHASHEILAATPREVLSFIDSRYGQGILRNWRNVAETMAATGITALETTEQAREILGLLSGPSCS